MSLNTPPASRSTTSARGLSMSGPAVSSKRDTGGVLKEGDEAALRVPTIETCRLPIRLVTANYEKALHIDARRDRRVAALGGFGPRGYSRAVDVVAS
jgi:hypothetical protein